MSPRVARDYGKKLNTFRHLSTPEDLRGIGKGRAVKIGMLEAKSDLRLFMDADNSTSFKEVDKLLPYSDQYDIVIGTRYSAYASIPETKWLKGIIRGIKDVIDVLIFGYAKRYTATGKQGRIRQLVSRGGNLAFTVLLGQNFSDQRCGFKLFNKKASDIIFPRIQLDGFGFDTEIFVIAKKHRLSVIEVPVKWFDDADESNVSFKDALNSFKEIFQIYGFMLSGKYSTS